MGDTGPPFSRRCHEEHLGLLVPAWGREWKRKEELGHAFGGWERGSIPARPIFCSWARVINETLEESQPYPATFRPHCPFQGGGRGGDDIRGPTSGSHGPHRLWPFPQRELVGDHRPNTQAGHPVAGSSEGARVT